MENRVSGIILSGVGDQTHLHLRDYLGKVSIIFPGDNIPEGMVSQITVNNYEGTRIATRYLISLGHRELMFLGGRDSSVTHRRRYQGFLDAATIREKVNRYWYSVHQRSFCLGRHAGGSGNRCGYPWPDFPDRF